MRQLIALTTVTGIALTAAVIAAPAASAKDDIRSTGSCSGTSRWVAEIGTDDGEIDVDYKVKTRSTGQRWTYTLTQNGEKVYTSTRTTRVDDSDDSDDDNPGPLRAEVEWERDRPDRSGTDRFVMRAVNRASGEVCRFSTSV
jgi:hypothetical protein